jgi:hypothetical protein
MGLRRHAGMKAEAGHFAHGITEPILRVADRQGLQCEHFASRLRAHGDAVGNRNKRPSIYVCCKRLT